MDPVLPTSILGLQHRQMANCRRISEAGYCQSDWLEYTMSKLDVSKKQDWCISGTITLSIESRIRSSRALSQKHKYGIDSLPIKLWNTSSLKHVASCVRRYCLINPAVERLSVVCKPYCSRAEARLAMRFGELFSKNSFLEEKITSENQSFH